MATAKKAPAVRKAPAAPAAHPAAAHQAPVPAKKAPAAKVVKHPQLRKAENMLLSIVKNAALHLIGRKGGPFAKGATWGDLHDAVSAEVLKAVANGSIQSDLTPAEVQKMLNDHLPEK